MPSLDTGMRRPASISNPLAPILSGRQAIQPVLQHLAHHRPPLTQQILLQPIQAADPGRWLVSTATEN